LIRLTREAAAQVDALLAHYERTGRLKAAENLIEALERGKARIEAAPDAGLPAPRPYPTLRQPGRLWIIERPYWFAYRPSPPLIVGVYYATSDLPRRV
jgi:plasmid stabilization system protein ParE